MNEISARGVLDFQEQVVFFHGKELLEKNPNVKAGNPIEISTLMGKIRLGVSGKNRSLFGRNLGGEMNPRMEEVLTIL